MGKKSVGGRETGNDGRAAFLAVRVPVGAPRGAHAEGPPPPKAGAGHALRRALERLAPSIPFARPPREAGTAMPG